MKYIPQIFDNDCGVAAVKMLLCEINKDPNYLYVPFKEQEGNYNYQQLVSFAKQYGLYLFGFRVESRSELLANRDYPLIVAIEPYKGVKHAVVVTKIKSGTVFYIDPSLGKRKLSACKFLDMFIGTGLMIEKFTPTKCPYNNNDKRGSRDSALSFTFQILEVMSIVAGVYYINVDSYIFLPIIFFSLFVIFEILLRSHLFKKMTRLDETMFANLDDVPDNRMEFYKRYEDYKKKKIVTPLNIFSSLLTITIFIIMIVMNNIYNIIFVSIALLLAVLDCGFIIPFIKRKNKKLEMLEHEAISETNDEDFIDKIHTLQKKTYVFGKVILCKKYCFLLVMLLSIILTMIASNIVSVPYIVFYLCLSYMLYQNAVPVFSYNDLKYEYIKSRARYINIIHQKDEMIK